MIPDLDPKYGSLVATTVRRAAARFGDRPVYVDLDGTHMSYRQLDERSERVAAGLQQSGVQPGSVCALTLRSGAHYLIGYAATAKAGAAVAGVNPRLPESQRRALVELAEPVLEFADPADIERLAHHGPAPAPPADPDRPVALVFTSGTTGRPKAAWFTDRQLATICVIDTDGVWGGDRPMPVVASTQFAHVGMATKLLWYLRLGVTTYGIDRWRPEIVLDLIERHRLTSLGTIAPQIALLLGSERFDTTDVTSVQMLIAGGAASPPALIHEAIRRFGAAYSIRYSSTESGGIATCLDIESPEGRTDTVGRPRPGVEIKIRTADGEPVSDGEVGEVWVRSGAVMSGYWNDPERTAETLIDGWVRMDDLGSLDHDGHLILSGRANDTYVRGGYNVAPTQVEAILASHPQIRSVAVVPQPHPVLGDIGVAVVVPVNPDRPPDLEEIRRFARHDLAHHELPERLALVEALPVNAVDKIDRRRIAALIRESHDEHGERPGSPDSSRKPYKLQS